MKKINLMECGGFDFEARIDGIKYGSDSGNLCQIDLNHRRDGMPGLCGVASEDLEPILITTAVEEHIRSNGQESLICTRPLAVLSGKLQLIEQTMTNLVTHRF